MAFCTRCGAAVSGAFCSQCGTPARPPGEPLEAGPAGPATATAAVSPAPPRRRTSPLVWILVIVLCLFGLGIIGALGTGAFLFHKARQAGVDADLWRTNPGLAVGRVMAAINPNLEVLRTNRRDGTVTLRDRHSGKEFHVGIDAARRGTFTLEAGDSEGKAATVEIGGDAKMPSWVPQYPGSTPKMLFSARGETDEGAGEAGSFTFETGDSASEVLAFYEQQARQLGMTLRTTASGGASTVEAGDEERDRYLKVIAVGRADLTKVSVSYGRKR